MITPDHYKNRERFPQADLIKYEGQHVAWNFDGTHILAGDEDAQRLVARLDASGYSRDDYVLSFVSFDSEMGGAVFNEGAWEMDE